MRNKLLASFICFAFIGFANARELEYSQIVAECQARGDLFAEIMQARNLGIPKQQIAATIDNAIKTTDIGFIRARLIYKPAHAWATVVIDRAYKELRDSQNTNPSALTADFAHACMDNPDSFIVPHLIDWDKIRERNAQEAKDAAASNSQN